jgi:hypothetical protein
MAGKPKPRRTDPHRALREHLVELLEHIGLSQWDILEFTKSAKHVSPERLGAWKTD